MNQGISATQGHVSPALRLAGAHFWAPHAGFEVVAEGAAHFQDAIGEVVRTIPHSRAEVLCVARLVPRGHAWLPGGGRVDVFVHERQVGRLTGAAARQFRDRLGALGLGQEPTSCSARIDTRGRERGQFPSYTLRLALVPFDDAA